MSKASAHFTVLAVLFFGIWFLLSRIDFVGYFHIEQLTRENERKLGDLVLDSMRKGNDELESDKARAFVEQIKQRLCNANGIADSSVTIHIVVKDDVNAFALPGRHLIVYTGLIRYCKSPEELAGVIAHEIAHMEHHHVMKKLMKEVGLSMLTTMAGGESGGEIMRETARLLSSTAFDRDQEREADAAAVHMLAKANIDPENLANFLFRLSQEKNNIPRRFELLNTHSDSGDRSAEILKLRKQESYHPAPLSTATSWSAFKEVASDDSRD